jgi:class 3 adenylate cyclase
MSSPDPPLRAESLRLWQRFHFRLTLVYGGVVLLLLTAMGAIFYVRALDAERRGLQGRLRAAAVSLASGIDPVGVRAAAEGGEDAEAVHRSLAARFAEVAAAEPEIASIYLLRPTEREGWLAFVADHVAHGNVPPAHLGRLYDATRAQHELDAFRGPIVEDEPYTDEWGTVLSGYAPVRTAEGQAVAIVGVDVFASRLADMRRTVLITTLLLFGVAALLVSALSWLVARNVRRPLSRIIQATASVAEGNFAVRASMDRVDEFGILGHQFDAMAEGLSERAFIKETFGAYVSPEVVRKVLERRQSAVAGERRRVTVLFADLRQFTSLSERMRPEEVVEILNAYLDRMTRIIAERGGRIDKFIGDAIMADWGALEEVEAAETEAVQAALEMVSALGTFNQERGLAARPLAIGIGLHVGDVIAGSIGSEQKLEFTVIGDTVNVASRLEGLTKRYGATIVASREIVESAGDACASRRLDRAIVAGREDATELCEILATDDPRATRIEVWERGMELYFAKRWEEAAHAFEEAASELVDPASVVQIERCRELVRNPPPEGWTGTARLTK